MSRKPDVLIICETAGEFFGALLCEPPRARHDGRKIDPQARHMYSEGTSVFGVRGKAGGSDERLARRAAKIHARAAEMFALEQHHRAACGRQCTGKRNAGLAGADNRGLYINVRHGRATNGCGRSRLPVLMQF